MRFYLEPSTTGVKKPLIWVTARVTSPRSRTAMHLNLVKPKSKDRTQGATQTGHAYAHWKTKRSYKVGGAFGGWLLVSFALCVCLCL